MRNGFLTSGAVIFLSAASAWAQTAPAPRPVGPASPAPAPQPVVIAPQPGVIATLPQPAVPPGCGPTTCPAPAGCEPTCATDVLVPCQADCRRPARCWVSAEYLMWWTQGASVPPLVTTGPIVPIPGCTGALNQPGTAVLFGGNGLNDDHFASGGRFTAGGWLDDCRRRGIEGSYFFLQSRSEDFVAASDGSSVLARPFTDPLLGPCAELVAFPAGVFPFALGGASGTVGASLDTRFQGGDLNVLCNLRECCNSRLDLLAGFRYLNLRERLTVRETILTGAGTTPLAGSTIDVLDRISTDNDFYGGQVGLRGEWTSGRVFVRATGKVALGVTNQSVEIAGATRITSAGGVATTLPGGLLALPSNIGRYERDRFSVVPELTGAVGYQVTDSLRAFVSYTFLYWSNVVRPGDAIDPVVNPTLVPTTLVPAAGPARPAFTFRDSDFWAQGVGFGVELRY